MTATTKTKIPTHATCPDCQKVVRVEYAGYWDRFYYATHMRDSRFTGRRERCVQSGFAVPYVLVHTDEKDW